MLSAQKEKQSCHDVQKAQNVLYVKGCLKNSERTKLQPFLVVFGLEGAEQCGILLTFTSAACIQYLQKGQKASWIPAVLILYHTLLLISEHEKNQKIQSGS